MNSNCFSIRIFFFIKIMPPPSKMKGGEELEQNCSKNKMDMKTKKSYGKVLMAQLK